MNRHAERGLGFFKYEGLGNDFVVVEVSEPGAMPMARARELCDRHRGIGADGVLLVLPPASAGARARMVVLNADGSIPEMCGNGLRCVALHVARKDEITRGDLVFDTDAGPRACTIGDDDGAGLVTIDMGAVRFVEDVAVDIDGGRWVFASADAGNPHAIVFGDVTEAEILRIGPRVATHARFPRGTNVEFARLRGPAAIDLVVWERGVGRTLACGTGACATVAVAVAKGHVSRGAEVTVTLPGGPLQITIDAREHAVMRGPARRVFSGTIE